MAKGYLGDEVFLALCTLTKDNIQKSRHPALLSVGSLGRIGNRRLQISLGPSLNWSKVSGSGEKKNNPIRSPYTLFKTGVYKTQTCTHRQKLCLSVDSYFLSPGCTPVLASYQTAPFYGTLPRVVSGSGIWIPPTRGWQMKLLVTCYCHWDKGLECPHGQKIRYMVAP